MLCLGLDVHARQSTLAFLGSRDAEPRTKTVRGSLRRTLAELERINGPFELAFEAPNGDGPVYDLATEEATRVVVAHPGKLRLIYRSKHGYGAADAKAIAQFLRAGFLSEVYVPPRELELESRGDALRAEDQLVHLEYLSRSIRRPSQDTGSGNQGPDPELGAWCRARRRSECLNGAGRRTRTVVRPSRRHRVDAWGFPLQALLAT